MTIDDRRARDRAAQRELIVRTARSLAEREGWDAVTTRRLSTEIEYSQPVIYKHFASLDELAEAVALEGLVELAAALGSARRGTARSAPGDAAHAVAVAYTRFADGAPALYDVMFTRSTRLPFGGATPPEPLSAAYAELRAAVEPIAGEDDVDTLTEVFWAALHGLVTLGGHGRLRPDLGPERLDRLVARFTAR